MDEDALRVGAKRRRRARSRAGVLMVIGATTYAHLASADEGTGNGPESAAISAPSAGAPTEHARTGPELTLREREALEVGELGVGRYLLGGALSIVPSFGAGQAVQGRWSTTGWKVALGEGVSLAVVVVSLSQFVPCATSHSDSKPGEAACGAAQFGVVAGTIALGGFYFWNLGDAWIGGVAHMHDYDAAKRKLETGGTRAALDRWWVLPTARGGAPGLAFGGTF